MSENKVVNALSYLSIVFAPFIFPFIVWLISKDNQNMHETAKHAFLLHLIPVVLSTLTFMLVGIMAITVGDQTRSIAILFIVLVGLVIIVDITMFIYNLYLGIKILVK